MGNSQNLSSSRQDFISIHLDENSCYPGGSVRGLLLARVSSPLRVTHLGIWIDGIEQVEWTQPQGPITKTKEVGDSFIKLQFPMQVEEQWPAGLTRIPFSLRLPLGLPPTFMAQSYSGQCHLFYTLSARLHYEGCKKPLVHSTPLRIESQGLSLDSPPQIVTESRSVNAWCCFPRGTSSLTCTFASKVFKPGEQVPIAIEIDNTRCSLDIDHISISVNQSVKIHTCIGYHNLIHYCVKSISIPGPKKRSNLSLNSVPFVLPPHFSFGCPVKNHKRYKDLFVQSSVETSSFECEYYVEVKAHFNLSGFGSHLKVTYPISIYNSLTQNLPSREESESSFGSTQASENAEVTSEPSSTSRLDQIFSD